jgi:MinD superfamily P-loop ATPase
MSFKIAIASGKGGTGKTTVSVTLFHLLSERVCDDIQLVDCDVEEPNDALFFLNSKISGSRIINQLIPEIDTAKCTFCRKCVDYCEFNAIVVIPPINFAEVNASLCHSCGACLIACKFDAITEKSEQIGQVIIYDTGISNGLVEGRLKVGSAMQTMLIKNTKRHATNKNGIIIYDAPPGTSCPVVETVSGADYVILVTEPTPFGLYDLKLTIELLKEFKKPFGVVVNKAGLGNTDVYKYLAEEGIELLGEIPFDQKYASQYAKGELFDNLSEKMETSYLEIVENLERRYLANDGNNYFKW